MKEIDPKKRLIGTDATLKTSNMVVQFVKESPARSALLGLTGFIFFKNLLAPEHPAPKEQKEQHKDASQQTLPNQQEKEQLLAQSDAASRSFDNSATVDLRPQVLGFESLPDFQAVSDNLPVASGLDAAAFVTKDMLAARAGPSPFADRLAMEKASLQAKLADEVTVDLSDYAPVTPYEFAGTRPGLNGPEKAPEPQLVSEIVPGIGENLLSLLGLLGGGVSTGSGTAAALATTAGVVVDGYIYNAKVYRVDSSGNVVSNVVYTDQNGGFTGLQGGTGKIVVEATANSMDMALGTAFTSALKLYAPGSATVVNPITTLIQNIIDTDPTKSVAQATSLIATGLGLPSSGIDYMTYDPVAAYAAGGTNQTNALLVQKVASQVAVLVTSASASISADASHLSAASESVITKIAAAAASYSSSANYDASTSFLNNSSALQASVQSLGVSSAAIGTVVLYNQKISEAISLTNVFSTQAVIQAPISAGWVNSSSFSTQFSNLQSSLTSTYGDISAAKTTVTETDSASDISTFGQLGSISGVSNPSWTADPGKLSGTYGTFKINPSGSWTFTANSAHNELKTGDVVTQSVQVKSVTGKSTATITVEILGTSDATTIGEPTISSVTEDSKIVSGNLTATGTIGISNPDTAQTFSTSVTSTQGNLGSLVLNANGSYTYTVANSAVKYLGDTVLSKVDTFTVTSADGTTKSVSFIINGANDAASIGAPTVASVSEDVGAVSGILIASGTISISDVDSLSTFNTSVVSAAGNLGALTLSSTGSYTYTVANSAVQYLGGSSTKVDTFTVTSADGTTKSVSFTINGVNDTASIGAPTVASVTEDVSVNGSGNLVASGSISISDVDQNQALFNTVVTSTAGNLGVLALNSTGSYTYTVANSVVQYLGGSDTKVDTFTVTSADGTTKSVSFTINGVNDAAVIGAPTVAFVTEDVVLNGSANLVASGSISITDVDSSATFNTAVASALGNLGALTLSSTGSYTYTVANSAVQYLGSGDSKVDTFVVTSADGTTKSVGFTLYGVNDGAVIGSPSVASVTEDLGANSSANLTAIGTISISDADQNQLLFNTTVTSTSGNLGALTLSSTGSYTYTVANSAVQYLGGSSTKVDIFTVTSADGTAQTVSFTISGVNDSAVIGAPTVASVTEDASVVAGNLTAIGTISISDTDLNQGLFNTSVTSAEGNLGVLALSANGSYTYTVANSVVQYLGGSDTKVDIFTVTSADGTTKSVSFTINGVNDAAVIVAPTVASVTEDSSVVAGLLSASGSISLTDADGVAAFNTSVISSAGNLGSLSLASNGTYTYSVANSAVQYLGAGVSKVDNFVVTSADGTTASVNFTINGVNDAAVVTPYASNLVISDPSAGLNLSGKLAVVDADLGQAGFVAQTNTSTSYGSFSIGADGIWQYSANNSFKAMTAGVDPVPLTDYISVTTSDGTTISSAIKLDLTIQPGPVKSVVNLLQGNDSLTASGQIVMPNVVAKSETGPYGTISVDASGYWTFTANGAHKEIAQGSVVSQSLNITSNNNTGVIEVKITGTNDAAVIGAPTVAFVTEDVGVNGAANLVASGSISITDVDSSATFNTAVASALGNLGALTLSSTGSYTYTVANSAVQYLGSGDSKVDTFVVTSADGTTKSVGFTLYGANDGAVIGSPSVASVTEDLGANSSANLTAIGTISISDADQNQLLFNTTVTSTSGNLGALTLSSTGSYTYTVANSAVQYLGGSSTKVDTFTVTSADGTAQTVSFTISGVNDAAVIGAPTVASVTEDASVIAGNLTAIGTISISDTDLNQGLFNTSVTSAEGNLGVLALNSTGSYTYTVANSAAQYLRFGDTKVDSFTVTSLDGTSKVMSFNVYGGSNDPAVIGAPTVTTVTEDASVVAGNLTASGTISISDVDQFQSSFNTSVTSAAGNLGSLALNSNGSYTYTVANSAVQYLGSGDSKVDTFVVTSADGTTKSVSFTINGVNDAASIGAPTVASVTEDVSVNGSGNLVASGTISISDVDSLATFNTSVVSATGNLGALTLSSTGSYTYTVANSAVQYLGGSDTKVDAFTVTSADGTTKSVSFTINGVNDAAVIGAPTVASVTEDVSVNGSGNLVASGSISISDVDQNQGLFNTSVTSAADNLGALALNANGSYTYTVANSAAQYLRFGDTKVDSFTVTSLDGTSKVVSFSVYGGGNDPAVIGAPTVTTVAEDASVVAGNLTAIGTISISDVDQNQSLFNTTVTSAVGNLGSLSLSSTGSYTYTVSNSAVQYLGGSDTKVDAFTVTSADGTTKSVSFTINGVNDAAVIGAPTVASVTEDVSVNGSGNLVASGSISISDVDQNQALFNTVVTSTAGNLGVLALNANGSYTYTVANSAVQYLRFGDMKVDSFTVTSLDGTSKVVSFSVYGGGNDRALIGDPTVTTVTEDASVVAGNLTAMGTISISDVDQFQSSFNTSVTSAAGNLGSLTLSSAGSYTYTVANSSVQYLGATQSKVDTFTIASVDGTTKNVSFTINGVNDRPVITATNILTNGQIPLTVKQGSLDASLLSGPAVQATDADTTDQSIPIQYYFADHSDFDSKYSYFNIDKLTGAISITKIGAESIAGESFDVPTDYYLNVRATDTYMRGVNDTTYLEQQVKIHVDKAVSLDGLSATLPGPSSSWRLMAKQDATNSGDGFDAVSVPDPALVISLPKSVQSVSFSDATLNLSNNGSDFGLITDTNTNLQANHTINLAQDTTVNVEIDVHSYGNYTIVGASDSDSHPILGTKENFRSDTVGILNAATSDFAQSSQASFSILQGDLAGVGHQDGYRVGVELRSATNPQTITGTLQIDDIEYIQFRDKRVTLIGADVQHNEDTIIEVDKAGNYVIVGSSDVVNGVANARKDVVDVVLDSVDSTIRTFNMTSDRSSVQMVLSSEDATTTSLLRDIESVRFFYKDANNNNVALETVVILAANGYSSVADAQTQYNLSDEQVYLYNPTSTNDNPTSTNLNDVYHY